MLGTPLREMVIPAIAPQDAYSAIALYNPPVAREYTIEPQNTVVSNKVTASVADNVYNIEDMFVSTQLPEPTNISLFSRMISHHIVLPLGKHNQASQGTR